MHEGMALQAQCVVQLTAMPDTKTSYRPGKIHLPASDNNNIHVPALKWRYTFPIDKTELFA
jgi:hypothetical protein